MTQPARPDPLSAAARVSEAAKELATDLAEGFRKSDRSFKQRSAVVGTWAVLALVCLWIACPSSGPSNALGAVARLDTGGIMGTQVLVQNDSRDLWTDVAFLLDGGWRLERRTVRAGDRLVLSLSAFTRDGQPAPSDLKPRQLTIECAEGKAVTLLGPARP